MKATSTIITLALLALLGNATAASDVDCSTYCSNGGHGGGTVIGTAPSCAGNCDTDCPGRVCTPWSAGSGCWTGKKVCCCARSRSLVNAFLPKPVVGMIPGATATPKSPTMLAAGKRDSPVVDSTATRKSFHGAVRQLRGLQSTNACSEYCKASNAGHGTVIGTAPSCAGNCDTDCPGRVCTIFSAGSGCWTGNKVCCCSN